METWKRLIRSLMEYLCLPFKARCGFPDSIEWLRSGIFTPSRMNLNNFLLHERRNTMALNLETLY